MHVGVNMVRTYKRKTDRIPITEGQLKAALEDIDLGSTIVEAADKYEINYFTLRRYLIKSKSDSNARLSPHRHFATVLTSQQEKELDKYLKIRSKMCYGLRPKEVRKVVYNIAVDKGIACPESWKKNECAGKDWYLGFMKRHPDLSLRIPQARSLHRAQCFNKPAVKLFFQNLEEALTKFPSLADGTRIFNLDETNTTTVPTKCAKVVAEKGCREVAQAVSTERGVLVTTCCIISANGSFLPPAMVFPRKKFKSQMLRDAPPGTLGLAYPTGWMTKEVFYQVIEHIIRLTSASPTNPVILILDNAEIHLWEDTLYYAKENGVYYVTLPPHCSHKLQPLDVSVFKSFKNYYYDEVNMVLLRNPGIPVTIYEVAGCVGRAFDRAFTPQNIKNGFLKTGIFPFNKAIFTETDFYSSEVTHRPDPTTSNSTSITNSVTPRISSSTPATSSSSASTLAAGSIEDVLIYPKAKVRETTRKPRKKGRSMLATSTPELLKRQAEKSAKEANKNVRKVVKKSVKRKLIESTSGSEGETDEEKVANKKARKIVKKSEKIEHVKSTFGSNRKARKVVKKSVRKKPVESTSESEEDDDGAVPLDDSLSSETFSDLEREPVQEETNEDFAPIG